MGNINIKIDADYLSDPEWIRLPDRQKIIYFAIVGKANAQGANIAELEWLMNEKLGAHIKLLEVAGFVRIDGAKVHPLGKVLRRVTTTEKNRQNREKARGNPTMEYQKLPQYQPAPIQNHSQDHSQEPIHIQEQAEDAWWQFEDEQEPDPIQAIAPFPATPAAPQQPKPAYKGKKPVIEHEEGVLVQMIADGLPEALAQELLDHRSFKKARMTHRAWSDSKREAERAGWPLIPAVEKWLAKQWQGLESKYLAGLPKPELTKVTVENIPGNGQERDGFIKDGRGHWKKRTGGVCL